MSSPFSVAEKRILVTGATSGIGKSTAMMLGSLGAKIMGTGRNVDRMAQLSEKLGSSCIDVFCGDLNLSTKRSELVAKITKPMDGLVFNAGIMKTLPTKFYSEQSFDEIIGTNLRSPVLLLSELLKQKKLSNGASIVFVTSVASVVANVGNGLYSASKGGLESILRVFALELSKSSLKIRVNGVSPAMVKTELWSSENSAVSLSQMVEDEKIRYPLGYGTVDDVAAGITFLLSDASRWMTGSILTMDGGYTIQ